MRPLIDLLDTLIGGLRTGFTVVLAVAALVAGLAWAVRTKRVSPFSAVGRFVRTKLDPLLAPLERRVVRSGSTSASVPWWALLCLFVVSVGALLVLGFVREGLVGIYFATTRGSRGARGLLGLAISSTFGALQLALLVRVIASWVGGAQSSVARLATRLTEWFLAPLRRLLPSFGSVDLSPLIAWFLLSLLQGAVLSAL